MDSHFFFTLRRDRNGVFSLPYSGDLFSLFPGEKEIPFLKNPQSFYSLLQDSDRERVRSSLQKDLESGYSYENRFRLNRGREWVLGELILTRRVDEGPDWFWDGFFRILSTERTGQELAEQALADSEALFRRYVESSPDGIFLADAQGRFLDVNEAACRITGYSREELIDMPLASLTYQDDLESTRVSFERVKSEGRTRNQCRFVRKNGQVCHWTTEAVKLDDGTFLGFNRDVTDQKKLEEQIVQMEKMEAIGQLAGGIAHDFNNQIAVIMGYSEMLVSRLDDPKLKRFAGNILSSARNSNDLTRKLLAFSRKGLEERRDLDIHHIIEEAADILSHTLDRKVTIEKDLKSEEPIVSGDSSQLQNLLMNLAINARDAMPEGGTLRFSTEDRIIDEDFCRKLAYRVDPGNFVEISVSDTGSGMDSQTLSHIFEPFFTTKEQGKGTGMGLSSVYGTVMSHRAVIDVDSLPGEGTVFRIAIPAGVGENRILPKDLPEVPARGEGSVVLVDDEYMIRQVAREILESLGYSVIPFADAADALDYLKKGGPADLAIVDLIMPGMRGDELFYRIRDFNRDLPVLFCSGYSLSEEARVLLDKGAAGFISKPFDVGTFAWKVDKALKKEGGD
jgi:PAS domain S-box-containing protein